ncbi:zinc metalloprotease [Desulfovibrio falkowii]|uniref:hypothetical protein n=1 Tax=Desulfovibrio falkowii TaxID=3136602 RepID=UPI0038B260B7
MSNQNPLLSPDHSQNVICHHEAGHAVMVIACGGRDKTIRVNSKPATRYEVSGSLPTQCHVLIIAAGSAAHYLRLEGEYVTGDKHDQQTAQPLLSELGHSEAWALYLIRAANILKDRWACVTKISQMLARSGVATEADMEPFIPTIAKLDVIGTAKGMNALVGVAPAKPDSPSFAMNG